MHESLRPVFTTLYGKSGYSVRMCSTGKAIPLCLCTYLSAKHIENASNRVVKAFADIILNAKTSS